MSWRTLPAAAAAIPSPGHAAAAAALPCLPAAAGTNRVDSGKRTAPFAMNWQEIEVVVLLEGVSISSTRIILDQTVGCPGPETQN